MITDRPTCFYLKASFAPCAILQLSRYDLDALQEQLVATIQRAPNFFLGSPVILDLEKINTIGAIDFARIKQILINHSLVPMGVRNGNDMHHTAAASVGLPVVTIGKLSASDKAAPAVSEPQKPIKPAHTNAKLITTPIRSGTQVYAKNADLIILAPVSAGAELLADGNIHVYGPLRGRALAGVQGNTEARIFCQQLEAELVSIAGYYLVQEDLQSSTRNGMMHIYLENEEVKIQAL